VLRVLFDTSSLVGAALQIGSVPHLALQHALATAQLCASPAALDELQRVLRRPKFDRYQPLGARREFFDIVARAAVMYEVSAEDAAAVSPLCRDAEDNKFLALASVCQADFIVSSDDDLLVLDPWRGVRIMKPADYLKRHG
jgi:putative PIN family toxin of toxin-antitoxin system